MLIQETGNGVVQHLNSYLQMPQIMNILTADAARLGELNLQNLPAVERHLFA